MTTRWAIFTGEYPPQPGGVADYTCQVANGLSSAGDEVTVYVPPNNGKKEIARSGVNIFSLPDNFGRRGLAALDRALMRIPIDRMLIQYVPHAFGWKAMNLPFAWWIASRARRFAPVWVMFHEVAFPLRWRPPTHAVLAVVNRLMVRLIAGAAERIFASIPAWDPLIHRFCPFAKPIEWLPIPSNIPNDSGIVPIRTAPGTIIGHFGTYGPATTDLLGPTLVSLLGRDERTALLLGRGGTKFRDRLVAEHPEISKRLVAIGELPPRELAARLRGCDILLQPFGDGISSRRTSAMAGIANGVPIVSNLGHLSEPLWSTLTGVSVAKTPSCVELATAAEAVLTMTPSERVVMGQRAVSLYHDCFCIERTIARLRTPIATSRT